MPKRSLPETTLDVLRLSEKQWAQLKGVARHFLGEHTFHASLPKYPPTKLKPSALRQIVEVDSPSTLAALLHVEEAAHTDPLVDYHKGGGLQETTVGLLSSLWNLIGFGPEFAQIYDHFSDYSKQKMNELDHVYAELVHQSYQPIDKRAKTVHDWTRMGDYDTDKLSSWQNEEDRRIHVALKGTSGFSDLMSDVSVLGTNRSGHEQEIQDYLIKLVETFPDYSFDVSGHSLGARELLNIFVDETNPLLEQFDRINLFNVGTTPTHNLDDSREAVADERIHFYLNSGDLLSNTFLSLIPSDRDNVIWSKPSHSAWYNHSLGQWTESV